MPTSLVRPNGHRSLQSSSYAYLAVLAVKPTALEADSVVPRTVDNSPCPSDSGSPYFVSTDDRTGVLVAVESTGPPCPQPGRETISRVDVIVDWIRQQIV